MIAIENGAYRYDDFALTLDFSLSAASFTAVIGPSGAGKSTLLSIIAGYEFLSTGRIVLNGQDVTKLPQEHRPVSTVFQDHNSFGHLTAFENVGLGLSPKLQLNESQTARVNDALARVSLEALAQRLPGEMSGGERQRIAIARALVRDRPILLLDEAFAALGPALRRDMQILVRSLGLTTVMVTHNPDDAKNTSDQVIFVGQGRARPPVPTATFFGNVVDQDIRHYLG